MFGQYSAAPSPRRGDTTPRLPPISSPSLLNDQSAMSLLDRSYFLQTDMQSISDERRARQILEEQVRVITLVCKKLNKDIEALDNQLSEKNFVLNTLEFKVNDLQVNSISLNKDLQFKMTRNDGVLNKLDSDGITFNSILKELQTRQLETTRNVNMRLNEIEGRINDLNSKFDSILMEQTMVMKNVEGDTVKQIQLIDGKTRTMLEDIRSQLYQTKAAQEAEISRLESRLALRIDETVRNTDKYDRLERKFEDYSQSINKRFSSVEDEFQRNINKLINTNEKLDHKVNKSMDERMARSHNDYDRLKRDMKVGFENLQEAIVALGNVVDGKIKLAEDRLEKEIEKIRKMVVLI